MGFIFAPLVGLLADRFGRRKILLLSTIGQATGFFIMGAAKSIFWLFVARTIGGIFRADTSAAPAYVADVTPSEKCSRALGWLGAADWRNRSRRPSWTVSQPIWREAVGVGWSGLVSDQYFQPPADGTDSDVAPHRGWHRGGERTGQSTMSGLVSQT